MASSRSKPAARRPPAKTPEGREQQLIGLAMDLAEEQMREGKASSSTINHFLKLASTREQLEQRKILGETRLLDAKYNAIEEGRDIKELYANAIKSMRSYQGEEPEDLSDDE